MRKLPLLIISIFTFFQNFSFSQSAIFPENGTIYNQKLHKIELIFHPDSMIALFDLANRWTDHSYPATFIYDQTDTLYQVGVRIKGNSSRNAKKLSVKISTDEFNNQEFQGLKTFNLNGNHNDPSVCREFLSTYVLGVNNVVAQRSNWVQLFINGNYHGLYNNAEQINKTFLESRFGNKNGNLYKCSWPADLIWINNDQNTYKNIINPSPLNERAYELKTNESQDDYSDLVHLIDVINNTSSSNFKTEIEAIFDVQAYLKTLAVEVLIGHWDNYFYNKNNYYLYFNTATSKFVYIPYDMDNTFGVQWGVSDINNRNIHQWGNSNNTTAPLTNKILAVTEFRKDYEQYIFDIISANFNENFLFPKLDEFKSEVSQAAMNDPYFNGIWNSDYGFTTSDWSDSYSLAFGSHVSFGIKPFISDRINSALQQFLFSTNVLENFAEENNPLFYPNPNLGKLYISVLGSFNLLIYDQIGNIVLSENNCLNNTITLEKLSNGIYFVNVQQKSKSSFSKIVLNR